MRWTSAHRRLLEMEGCENGCRARDGYRSLEEALRTRTKALTNKDKSEAQLAAIAVDGGDLPLGGGLLALVRPALSALEPGGVLAVSRDRGVCAKISSWCRADRDDISELKHITRLGRP